MSSGRFFPGCGNSFRRTARDELIANGFVDAPQTDSETVVGKTKMASIVACLPGYAIMRSLPGFGSIDGVVEDCPT